MDVFQPNGFITLTTDFGLEDPFVGVMKGVILQRFANATIVDLTHGVRAQAVSEAGFWLERCYRWFPIGSVHVAVVDPGVGTDRTALVVAAAGHAFLAPDNGLLSRVLAQHTDAEVCKIDVDGLGLATPSRTFHGRDVFAPVAAMLASGRVVLADVGPAVVPDVLLDLPVVNVGSDNIEGRVATIDRFGNLITDIIDPDVVGPTKWRLSAGGEELRLCRTYADAETNEVVGLVNSFGCLELAAAGARAADILGLSVGDAVTLSRLR